MEVYILKSTSCIAVFYLFYKLFLENENMHIFKRFYLLGAIFISLLIPLLTFTTFVNQSETISPVIFTNTNGEDSNSFSFLEYLPLILWSIYFIGVAFFTFRFGKNLISLLLKIKRNPRLKVKSHINVLLQKNVIPHTFLKYIFLNKTNFEAKEIPEEVLLHEQTHANQRHSIDILLIEILQIIFWFNPFIYFFKNSIKLNHEFLADQAVLSKGVSSSYYQNILLLFSSNTTTPTLANSINYSLIKKRFTVMKKQTSKSKVWIRSLLLLPLLAILIFSFSTIEEVEKNEIEQIEIQEGATKAQINEYNKLAKYYNELDQSNMRIKKSDVDRLTYIYNLMTTKQRKNAVPFPNFPPLPPSPDKAPEPMVVKKGVNDKDPMAPPPPPPPKAPKVVKGVNDTEANIPPPPPKEPKTLKDPIENIEKLADEGARFLFFDGGPHHKNGMDISKEKAIEILKKFNGVTVNVRDDNYLYKIVEIRLEGC